MGAPSKTEVAVVGAGPYGLSVSAHLAARGIRFRIFGRAMESWRTNMPKGMYLKSAGRASSLSDPGAECTLEQFCRSAGREYSAWKEPVSAELFTEYGEWFQKNLVPGLDSRQVLACERDADGFLLEVEGGETVAAKSVVISSGYMTSPRMPEELAGLPQDLVSHSSVHASFEPFRDKDVIVLGAGQSALESAALLREAGARPTLVARRPSIKWGAFVDEDHRTLYERLRRPKTALGWSWRSAVFEHRSLPFHYLPLSFRKEEVDTAHGPAGAWWLRERVIDRMPILAGWTLREARGQSDHVVLRIQQGDQTMDLQASHVIAATGYRVRPESFPFLSPGLKQAIRWDHGSPALSRYFESSVPGLHFTGLASAYSFGPIMRFVAGAHVTVPRLCGYLAARHPRSGALNPGPALTPQNAA